MRVKIVSASCLLPKYQTTGAAGMDIAAYLSENIVIESGETVSIQTGLRMEIPIDYEFQLRSRSGLSLKGIVVANSPATIDSDFRGEIKILLHNASKEPFIVENGMRIAQGVFAAYERVVFEQVEISDLSTTERGQKGFGSTGVSSKQELKVGTTLMAKNESLDCVEGLLYEKLYVAVEVHEGLDGSVKIIGSYNGFERFFSTNVNHPYYFGNFFSIV